MMGFLGGILKTILSPVTKLIFRALYGVFIKGPLWVLNVETKALTYATGAETDRLIFDTSLKDGTGKLNFFAINWCSTPFIYGYGRNSRDINCSYCRTSNH